MYLYVILYINFYINFISLLSCSIKSANKIGIFILINKLGLGIFFFF